jgi:hypothetical protein
LVLGSSRVLKLEPDYLTRHTGVPFFNAGVNHGKAEDYLALLRYYRQALKRSPQVVVLGLDVCGFAETSPVDARLLSQPELAQLVPEAVAFRDRYRRWQELLSWQQTKSSIESLFRGARWSPEAAPLESIRADGLIVYHQREQQLREQRYDFSAALHQTRREYAALSLGFDRLSPLRCELLEALIQRCHQWRTKLYVFTTPIHPQLERHLCQTTPFASRRAELIEWLSTKTDSYGFRFCDFSRIELFDGDAHWFVDGIHPLEPNTRRLIDRLLDAPSKRFHDVVQ